MAVAIEASGEYPIVIADQGDNTGGGAPGDSTHILRLFLDRGLEKAAVLYVVDPESAAAAVAAGAPNCFGTDFARTDWMLHTLSLSQWSAAYRSWSHGRPVRRRQVAPEQRPTCPDARRG